MNNENMTLDGSLLEVFLELKRIIMKQTHVGTLAIIQSVDPTTKTLKVKPFPLSKDEEEKTINCYYFKDDSFTEENKGDIIAVLFLDKRFINNLKAIERGSNIIMNIDDEKFHSEDYAIAIQTY